MKQKKKPIPLSEVDNHFKDQLEFLKRSNLAYDAGNENEFKRIAITLRTIFYKSRTSTPLLDQLGLADIEMTSYSRHIDGGNLLADTPLAVIRSSAYEFKLLPAFDNGAFPPRKLCFGAWWDEIVLRDMAKVEFSRKDLVVFVANQDGGGHVDPEIDEKFYDLKHENSIGLFVANDSGEKALNKFEEVYLRHIGFEAEQALSAKWKRVIGNRDCQCGSGRKNRYCCGKPL
jgi:hypothetical protein